MIGSRVKHFRELNNISREWLGAQLGIDATQVGRIENNQCEVSVQRLHKIAQLFKVSVIDMIEEKYLLTNNEKDYRPYGPIESSYIRYVLYQNEMLRGEYIDLIKEHSKTLNTLGDLQKQFKRLLDAIEKGKLVIPSHAGGGGGGKKILNKFKG